MKYACMLCLGYAASLIEGCRQWRDAGSGGMGYRQWRDGMQAVDAGSGGMQAVEGCRQWRDPNPNCNQMYDTNSRTKMHALFLGRIAAVFINVR